MLSDADRQILDFASRTYRYPGLRDNAIRDELGITPARYFQRLAALLNNPAAEVAYPHLVHRLRRVQQQRIRLKGHGRTA